MARRRKMTYSPGQLTLFDIMAGHIENIRAENIQADLEDESGNAGQFTITATEQPENVAVQEDAPPYARLGLNEKGAAVYELKGGGRMISRNPEIMQTVDGDKDTSENLFRKEKLQYLTVEEVAKFTNGKLTSEVQNARQTDKPAGNRQPRTQARNDTGSQKRRIQQFGLFNSGQVGVEQPGQAERVGTTGGFGLSGATGSAGHDRKADSDQRISPLRVLEPSAGIGNFIGMRPDDFNAQFLAVEIEPTTAAIAKYLYPEARHINSAFQNSQLTKPRFDAVVGNPPFGNQALYDPEFPELKKFSIHNYFLAKSLSLLREGGVGAFVVSRFFLDAADPTVREHISQYADFLGAVRLPETAFRQNALTDVTTDIVFFRKNTGENKRSKEWVRTASIEADDLKNGGIKPAIVNSYFAANPNQIIGKMAFNGGMFRDALNCINDTPLMDLGHEIEKRLEALPRNVYVPRAEAEESAAKAERDGDFLSSAYFQSLKMGALCVEPLNRKIVYKTAGEYGSGDYEFLTVKNDTARQRLASIIQIRDTLRELIDTEKSDGDESRMESLRGQLNRQYDAFAKRYGHLNSQTNRALMRDDPEHSLLESLEVDYDKGVSKELAKKQGREARPASARKAAIFRQRVLKPAQVVEHTDSVQDALVISLRESGRVDFSRMNRLLNRPAAAIQKELQEQGLIFLNPASEEWEIRDKYLTGNVRSKLHRAQAAAQNDERYAVNVEALTAAMPPDIEAVDIGIKFGSTWVPGYVFSDFIEHLHGGKGRQSVAYLPTVGRWEAKVSIYDHALASNVWGIPEYP